MTSRVSCMAPVPEGGLKFQNSLSAPLTPSSSMDDSLSARPSGAQELRQMLKRLSFTRHARKSSAPVPVTDSRTSPLPSSYSGDMHSTRVSVNEEDEVLAGASGSVAGADKDSDAQMSSKKFRNASGSRGRRRPKAASAGDTTWCLSALRSDASTQEVHVVRELLTKADGSELTLLENTLHAGYCEENYFCWREVYALLLTHAPHLLAGSPMDFQRALGRSSTLLHDAESLYIKYMSASARYSVSLDIDTAVQLDQIFESPTGLSNRSCEHVVDCFHRALLDLERTLLPWVDAHINSPSQPLADTRVSSLPNMAPETTSQNSTSRTKSARQMFAKVQ